MKKIFVRLFLCCTLFLFFAACSKDTPAEIKLDSTSISIPNDNTAITLAVTSNVDWSSSQSTNVGFIVTPQTGGPGVTSVSISALPNTTNAVKASDLTITGAGVSAVAKLTQQSLIFSISPTTLEMEATASSKKFEIKSNTSWKISSDGWPAWIKSVSPNSGNGDALITLSVNDNPDRILQKYTFKITYGSTWGSILLTQKAAHNDPPSKPNNIKPQANSQKVSIMPLFSWDACTDINKDELKYTVKYSVDGENWNVIDAGKNTSVNMAVTANVLKANTRYFYKVTVDDGYDDGVTESDISTFYTGDADAYADGSYTVYQKSLKSSPIKLVFTGDGYLPQHFKYGELFDKNIDEAIEALFAVEPYKTYREYFSVYKVASYSVETGVSDDVKGIKKNTSFSARLTGGTGITCNADKVFAYALKVGDMVESDLQKTSICLIINANVYAGTCIQYIDGKSIGMVPVTRGSNSMTTFKNVVCHEYGGHGFGRLADEYTNYETQLPESEKNKLLTWQGSHYSLNVSPYPESTKVPWSKFIGLANYDHVGVYSGAYLYKLGAYKSEFISCMVDNRLYYNTQSRYLIVERIHSVAGEQFSLDEFIAKDVQKAPVETKTHYDMSNFVPLAPPILRYK
ncbi:MAG: M64 family metallopeptidase [Bacteroidales bacterium]